MQAAKKFPKSYKCGVGGEDVADLIRRCLSKQTLDRFREQPLLTSCLISAGCVEPRGSELFPCTALPSPPQTRWLLRPTGKEGLHLLSLISVSSPTFCFQVWIRDLRGSCPAASGNIKVGCCWIAFSTDPAGVLGLVPLQGERIVSHLPCHSDAVTDFDFSPFDEQILATASADECVKVWRLSHPGQDLSSSPHITLGPEGSRLDLVLFHPTADGLLASGALRKVKIWDVGQQQSLADLERHEDQVQSLAWKPDGSLLGTSCKDKKVRIFDPRAKPTACQSVLAHANGKDSRLAWVDADRCLLSVGFNQVREREVRLWDTRKFSSSLASLTLDASPRALIPLFDPSTGLLVLAGKGENVLFCYEVVMAGQPALMEVNQCLLETTSHGVAPVPKLVLDVMACEVMRLLQLTEGSIVPVSYVVPRKSTQEFQKDLFPDCPGNTPAASAQVWWAGGNPQVEKVSLHPAGRPTKAFTSPWLPPTPQQSQAPESPPGGADGDPAKDLETSASSSLSSPSSSLASPSSATPSLSATSGFASSPSQRSLHSLLGSSSGLRHIQGAVLHRSSHITNLRGLSLTTPGECDGFCANRKRVAVPLLSAGGQVAILEASRSPPPTSGVPSFLCFLGVAGEDAKIRLWRVEPGGLQKMLLEPEIVLQGHTEKIYSVKFHPLASDILASSSYDMSLRVWDVRAGRQELKLDGHRDQIFSLAWSPDGRRLASVCKDGKIRVFEPRQASECLQEGPGPEGSRGARIVWVCGGQYLLVSGFDSQSERQLSLYQAKSVTDGPVAVVNLDVSPSTLIPFYDPDTSMVFLSGKGDTRLFMYEVVPEAPFFLECNSFFSSDPHKGFQFLPKTECDVREVEIARALRLRQSSVEPVAFRLPRVKKEFFQDDLYPDTEVWWEPALSAAAWLKGSDGLGNRDDPLPQDLFEGVDEEEWVRGGHSLRGSAHVGFDGGRADQKCGKAFSSCRASPPGCPPGAPRWQTGFPLCPSYAHHKRVRNPGAGHQAGLCRPGQRLFTASARKQFLHPLQPPQPRVAGALLAAGRGGCLS
nr:coronin-7-like [Pogona vitticeps]